MLAEDFPRSFAFSKENARHALEGDRRKRRLGESNVADFYTLGLGDIFAFSAMTGTGTGELLDEVVKHLPNETTDTYDGLPRFALVGRPNVGKSSMINAFLGHDRHIVTDIAGKLQVQRSPQLLCTEAISRIQGSL